jgi:hypothetical protein
LAPALRAGVFDKLLLYSSSLGWETCEIKYIARLGGHAAAIPPQEAEAV